MRTILFLIVLGGIILLSDVPWAGYIAWGINLVLFAINLPTIFRTVKLLRFGVHCEGVGDAVLFVPQDDVEESIERFLAGQGFMHLGAIRYKSLRFFGAHAVQAHLFGSRAQGLGVAVTRDALGHSEDVGLLWFFKDDKSAEKWISASQLGQDDTSSVPGHDAEARVKAFFENHRRADRSASFEKWKPIDHGDLTVVLERFERHGRGLGNYVCLVLGVLGVAGVLDLCLGVSGAWSMPMFLSVAMGLLAYLRLIAPWRQTLEEQADKTPGASEPSEAPASSPVFLLHPESRQFLSGKGGLPVSGPRAFLRTCLLFSTASLFACFSPTEVLLDYWKFENDGIVTTADIVDVQQTDETTFVIVYRYSINTLDGPADTFGEASISETFFKSNFQSEKTVQVRYLRTEPRQSALEEQHRHAWFHWVLLPGCMIVVWIASAIAFLVLWLRRKWLERTGRVLPGAVVLCTCERSDPSSILVKVHYSFETPEGKTIHSQATGRRIDLNAASLPKSGSAVSVLYGSDSNYFLL